MEIKVKNIKSNVQDLNKLIANYENNLLNVNNILSDINTAWLGEKANSFFDKTSIEQRKVSNNILELKSLVSVYDYVANEYSSIGNVIKFDFRKRETVNNVFDDFINDIRKILRLYNDIPAKYAYLVQSHKRYFSNLIENVNYIKRRYNTICDKINNIETNVKIKISKINIELIKESDIRNLM